jgi:hypothetical protein
VVELYPGDLGSIIGHQLALSPDKQVSNVDFSAWLQIYKDSKVNNTTASNKLSADFTKDGILDNVDFTLWMASYKKLLEMEQ